jgi:hypothetical protein
MFDPPIFDTLAWNIKVETHIVPIYDLILQTVTLNEQESLNFNIFQFNQD